MSGDFIIFNSATFLNATTSSSNLELEQSAHPSAQDFVKENTVWLSKVTEADEAIIGGKAANLARMIRMGYPVPDGLVLLPTFIALTGERKLEVCDILLAELQERFGEDKLYALRSSATVEDSHEQSFAGQFKTKLGVSRSNLTNTLDYLLRKQKNIADSIALGAQVSTIIQPMINAQAAGVCFTLDPVLEEDITIEAVRGLGESFVSGKVAGDTYVLDRDTLKEKSIAINLQGRKSSLRKFYVNTSTTRIESRKLPIRVTKQLAKISLALEESFGYPLDIEWIYDKEKILWIVQARPITTLTSGSGGSSYLKILRDLQEGLESPQKEGEADIPEGFELKWEGTPASRGVAQATYCLTPHRLRKGQILVTQNTDPSLVRYMKKASAIVTSIGGRTCHAAIVSRELGIPCIVGVSDILTSLLAEAAQHNENQKELFVDAINGRIYLSTEAKTVNEDEEEEDIEGIEDEIEDEEEEDWEENEEVEEEEDEEEDE